MADSPRKMVLQVGAPRIVVKHEKDLGLTLVQMQLRQPVPLPYPHQSSGWPRARRRWRTEQEVAIPVAFLPWLIAELKKVADATLKKASSA